MAIDPQHADVLNSWKEIAAYLGRGVRTAQRWEKELLLPIHRPKGRDRSAVLAFPTELDRWLQYTPLHSHNVPPVTVRHARADEALQRNGSLGRSVLASCISQRDALKQLRLQLQNTKLMTRKIHSQIQGRREQSEKMRRRTASAGK